MLKSGAAVNQVRTDGATPLLTAVKDGDIGVVRLLLENGAAAVDHARSVAVARGRLCVVALIDSNMSCLADCCRRRFRRC